MCYKGVVCSRKLLARVYRHAFAVEVGVTHSVWVVVAPVGVAKTGKSILRVGTTASVGLANVVVVVLARVRSESKRVRVRLPERHAC